jgi:hypothetical protein
MLNCVRSARESPLRIPSLLHVAILIQGTHTACPTVTTNKNNYTLRSGRSCGGKALRKGYRSVAINLDVALSRSVPNTQVTAWKSLGDLWDPSPGYTILPPEHRVNSYVRLVIARILFFKPLFIMESHMLLTSCQLLKNIWFACGTRFVSWLSNSRHNYWKSPMCGFPRNPSTTDQIFYAYQILEKQWLIKTCLCETYSKVRLGKYLFHTGYHLCFRIFHK